MPQAKDTDYWKRLGELLDEALALPEARRADWLEALGAEGAPYREALAGMLRRAGAGTDEFMERPVGVGTLEAASETLSADHPGDEVGPYRLLARIGSGGMGTVWRAVRSDGSVQRHVALKLPRAGWSPGLAERLRHECAVLSTLEHPGIARLYDAGVTGAGRPWLAMEIIEGVPIDQFCRDRKLDVRARLALFLEVARAVAYAHARLVVHRDLKPGNILVDTASRPHVVDFGLAKLLDGPAGRASDLTQTLGRTLTPDYASPEQIRGEPITVGSDVYSLGVVLYELLAGRRPYRLKRESAAALEEAIVEADVPLASSQAPKAIARGLRGDLDTILARALGKRAAERYPTVEALAQDVERHLRGEPVLARRPSLAYVAGRFVRRHRVGVTAGALLAVAIVAGLAGTIHQGRVAAQERDRALRELRFAEASDEFMRFVLSEQSSRPLPAPELLRRAERSAAQLFADDAALRSRMQMLVADLHGELSDFARAEAVVRDARASAEASGDRWLTIQADCVLAAVLAVRGRAEESLALYARAMPPVEADPAADPTTAQVCFSQRSVTLRNLGQSEAAARDAQAGLKALDLQPGAHRVNRIFLRLNVADAMTKSGDLAGAVKLYEDAVVDLGRIGRGGTSAGLLLSSNLLVMLSRAGQYRRAVEAYERMPTGEEPDPSTFSSLAINYGRVLFEVGRRDEAERHVEAGRARKAMAGDLRGEAFARLTSAGFACSGGEPDCESRIAALREPMRQLLPPNHSTFASMRYLEAQAAMARGHASDARRLASEAVALFEGAPDRNLLAIRALGVLALAQQGVGEPQAAEATAAKAVEAARGAARGFTHSDWLGGALLVQARIAAAHGEVARAKALLAEARPHLAGATGEGSPAVRGADAFAASLR